MSAFVTGGAGFIGKRLVRRLLERDEEPVYVLVYPPQLTPEFVAGLKEFWGGGAERVTLIGGDISKPDFGVSASDAGKLEGRIDHFFHLAAIYDLRAPPEQVMNANIAGVANALTFAKSIKAGRFHHVSSIAAAGLYDGVFREDMFEEARGLEHPYYGSKHKGEGLVRAETQIPWRIYRPAICVGDSRTGEIDKIDGPYYFFKLIQKIRDFVPSWFPMVGLEGGRINVVPVDFLVAAMDHLAHLDGLDGRTFHLTDPNPLRVGDMLNVLARAAHARLHHRPGQYGAVRACAAGADPQHHGADPVPPHAQHDDEGTRAAGRHLHARELPDALRQPRDAQALAPGRHHGPPVRGLCLAAMGLLGAASRPGSVRRPLAARRGRGQARPGDGRLGRHRQGDRAQARPSRSENADRGARPGKARSDAQGILRAGPRGRDLQRRHLGSGAMRRVH